MNHNIYVDASYKSLNKVNEELCGDRVEMVRAEHSYIVVLSDGLGSGVKANILSTLTSKIISTMIKEGCSIEDTVETIVHTLPVCNVRKLAYSTFSILQVFYDNRVYLVEFDSPGCIYIKNGTLVPIDYTTRVIAGKTIKEAHFNAELDDILVLISDGVVYAGIGALLNLGWDWNHVADYVLRQTKFKLNSARLTNRISEACSELYMGAPGDDTTVATVKIVPQKIVNLYSGPPLDETDDERVVTDFMNGDGKKIICGGSTANIVSRILKEDIITSICYEDDDVPPIAQMANIDLVTEGVLTLKKTLDILKVCIKNPTSKESFALLDKKHGAAQIAKILIEECTHLNLFIGQKINPAHQNPNMPVDLSIRGRLLQDIYECMNGAGKLVYRYFY